MAEITIRHAEPGDAEAIAKINSGPRAIWGTFQLPYPSVEFWRNRLSNRPDGLYHLVACVEDEVVGTLGLHTFPANPRRRHAAGIGMSVRDDWQGKGVGTALMRAATNLADNWLGLTRLELEVYTDNAPALALYRKFGFEVEGTHRRYAFRDGEYVDAYMMARLKT